MRTPRFREPRPSTTQRCKDLLEDARTGRFQIIITESLDRLSRSQADIASLYETLSFYGVRVETLADGLVSEIHVGLKGTMAALS